MTGDRILLKYGFPLEQAILGDRYPQPSAEPVVLDPSAAPVASTRAGGLDRAAGIGGTGPDASAPAASSAPAAVATPEPTAPAASPAA